MCLDLSRVYPAQEVSVIRPLMFNFWNNKFDVKKKRRLSDKKQIIFSKKQHDDSSKVKQKDILQLQFTLCS